MHGSGDAQRQRRMLENGGPLVWLAMHVDAERPVWCFTFRGSALLAPLSRSWLASLVFLAVIAIGKSQPLSQ